MEARRKEAIAIRVALISHALPPAIARYAPDGITCAMIVCRGCKKAIGGDDECYHLFFNGMLLLITCEIHTQCKDCSGTFMCTDKRIPHKLITSVNTRAYLDAEKLERTRRQQERE